MSRIIDVNEIKQIAIGSSLLGSGGGGNPYVGQLMAISAVKENGPVKLIQPNDLPFNSYCVSISMIGAPSVAMEKFPNGSEFVRVLKTYEKYIGKKICGVFPAEAGGINSLMPIITASKLNIPVLDVDGMGRAFPELQMSTFVLGGHSVTPMVLTDERKNEALINTINPKWAEKITRGITVEMGASCTSASDGTTSDELSRVGVLGTITFCQKIGEVIQNYNRFSSIEEALNKLLSYTHGFKLLIGKIIDISHNDISGFNYGITKIKGLSEDNNKYGEIYFQNENIIMKIDGHVLATSPDLITIVDMETLLPITNEELKYGKRVFVIGIPSNEKWRTVDGIRSVGPKYFHYDVDYIPIEKRYKDYLSN